MPQEVADMHVCTRYTYAPHYLTCFGLRVHYLDQPHTAPGGKLPQSDCNDCGCSWVGGGGASHPPRRLYIRCNASGSSSEHTSHHSALSGGWQLHHC
jgi:hypothetical protein